MNENNYYIIVSEVIYSDSIKEEPLVVKINENEHAILAWINKSEAENFLSERKLTNCRIILINKKYLEEQAEKYRRNNLVLKIRLP